MSIEEHRFEDFSELTDALAHQLSTTITEAIESRHGASIVLPGGSTPGPIYDQLALMSLPWDQVQITLSDERWVQANDTSSNEGMLRRRLLHDKAAHAQFVSLLSDVEHPADAVAEVGARLREMRRPYDAVMVGMGDDFHTASLFPDAPQLAKAMDMDSGMLCAAMTPRSTDVKRMSLTLPTLMYARRLILLIRGWEKWALYQRAYDVKDTMKSPISALLRQTAIPVDVYWAA